MVGLVMPLALVAFAAVSAIEPSSGEADPGETVTATISVDPTLLSVCLTGSSDDPLNIAVTFVPACDGGGLFADPWESEMRVSVAAATAPGDHTVTVVDLDIGGLIYQWPLTVTGPPSTTTTTSSSTSSTSSTTTTSTSAGKTTTSRGPIITTTSSVPPTTSDEDDSVAAPSGPSESDGGSGGIGAPGSDPSAAPAGGSDEATAATSTFSEVALSSGLIETVGRSVSPVVAEALFSPLVVAEVLLRALGRTMADLMLPLILMVLLGAWMFWRLRPHDEEWEVDSLGENSPGLSGPAG